MSAVPNAPCTVFTVMFWLFSMFALNEDALAQKRPPPRTQAPLQTFVPYRYTDPMTGMEAFTMLIPEGWRAEGSITWSTNPALPAQSRFRFFNPA